MKHFILSSLCIFLFRFSGSAFTLSEEAEISILTCSPGTELYSLFGHTGIRVYDPRHDTDIVFNYGTFDFQTPHFYLKYAWGLLPYQLTVSSYPGFLRSYKEDNRSVYVQKLRLDSVQKQQMFDSLLENYRPENRSYLYNFLYDNCTTRSRDILLKSLPRSVEWKMPDADKSFWKLLDEYLSASPWVQWGIHTILGQGGNRKATVFQYMFLPDYLMYGLNTARYNGQRLAGDAEVVYRATDSGKRTPWYFAPWFVFLAGVLVVVLLLHCYQSVGLLRTVSFLLFLFTGLVGGLIVFLGAFTEHPITAPNWNILWGNPLNLLVLPFLFCRTLPRWIRSYLRVYLILLAVAIPAWPLLQPAVPMASLPLIGLMIYLCLRLRAEK